MTRLVSRATRDAVVELPQLLEQALGRCTGAPFPMAASQSPAACRTAAGGTRRSCRRRPGCARAFAPPLNRATTSARPAEAREPLALVAPLRASSHHDDPRVVAAPSRPSVSVAGARRRDRRRARRRQRRGPSSCCPCGFCSSCFVRGPCDVFERRARAHRRDLLLRRETESCSCCSPTSGTAPRTHAHREGPSVLLRSPRAERSAERKPPPSAASTGGGASAHRVFGGAARSGRVVPPPTAVPPAPARPPSSSARGPRPPPPRRQGARRVRSGAGARFTCRGEAAHDDAC